MEYLVFPERVKALETGFHKYSLNAHHEQVLGRPHNTCMRRVM